jgi:hypothetical protein
MSADSGTLRSTNNNSLGPAINSLRPAQPPAVCQQSPAANTAQGAGQVCDAKARAFSEPGTVTTCWHAAEMHIALASAESALTLGGLAVAPGTYCHSCPAGLTG